MPGLGLDPEAGYFASRSAAMGAVGADTVIATFYNFSPALVRAAIPWAWGAASPATCSRPAWSAADAALRRMLGEAVGSTGMERAAALARRAAERAAGRYEGRPLFAAHAGLPWPEPPHLVVWHAQTLLREFRGDGHITALVDHDLDPVEALVMHLASGELPGTFLRDSRGWPDDDWDAGVERLVDRGLVRAVGHADGRVADRADRARAPPCARRSRTPPTGWPSSPTRRWARRGAPSSAPWPVPSVGPWSRPPGYWGG